jgi:hypothetical protein
MYGPPKKSIDFPIVGRLQVGRRRGGMFNWPGAVLAVSDSQLTLRAPWFGDLIFERRQVWKLTEHRRFPLLSWGVQIHHAVRRYPETVRFLCWANPRDLLRSIETVGFIPEGKEDEILCLVCGRRMTQSQQRCAACGWSYVDPT